MATFYVVSIYIIYINFIFICVIKCIFSTDLTMQLWLSWNLLCSPDWLYTLRDLPAFRSWLLEFEVCAPIPSYQNFMQCILNMFFSLPYLSYWKYFQDMASISLHFKSDSDLVRKRVFLSTSKYKNMSVALYKSIVLSQQICAMDYFVC